MTEREGVRRYAELVCVRCRHVTEVYGSGVTLGAWCAACGIPLRIAYERRWNGAHSDVPEDSDVHEDVDMEDA
ncbi:MAG: hypothetical protein ABR529_06525 [Actinomycetota bacterium]